MGMHGMWSLTKLKNDTLESFDFMIMNENKFFWSVWRWFGIQKCSWNYLRMRGEGLFLEKPGLSSRPSFKLSLVFPTQFWLRLGFEFPCFDTLSHWLCTLIWRPFWNPIFTFLLSTEGSRTILSIWSSLVSFGTPSWKFQPPKLADPN